MEAELVERVSSINTGGKLNQLTSILNCSSSHIKDHFILIHEKIQTQIAQNYIRL